MECFLWCRKSDFGGGQPIDQESEKKEVRKQGAPTKTKRGMTIDEFKSMQHVLMEKDDIIRRYGIPSFVKFQFHLIARIDDTTQFLMENLAANPDFDFTLRSKLRWSKNVNEERDATLRISF
jgi:hypothetical protein